MKKKYKIIIGVVSFLLVILIIGSFLINKMNQNLDKVVEIEIEPIDLALIDDGIYEGSYRSLPIDVVVLVHVINHEITEIEITKHDNGQGSDGEAITEDVILYQSLDVDLVAGATYSSKIILLAIEDALIP